MLRRIVDRTGRKRHCKWINKEDERDKPILEVNAMGQLEKHWL